MGRNSCSECSSKKIPLSEPPLLAGKQKSQIRQIWIASKLKSVKKKIDAAIQFKSIALFDADKLVQVLNAASTSEFKVLKFLPLL